VWFPFSVHLIEGFFQTVRSMDMLTRHREAMIGLGTLAAGLTHELNNPASANARAVDALRETCDALLTSLTQLAERSLSAEQFIALDNMRRELDVGAADADPLDTMDREDALTSWLDARGIQNSWRIAPALGEQFAYDIAAEPTQFPQVIVYSQNDLNIDAQGVRQDVLSKPSGAYRFRYRGLRLIEESEGRYVLINEIWYGARGRVIVLQDSDAVRFEFVDSCVLGCGVRVADVLSVAS